MQKDKFEKIINFLLGASWAIVLFGALITFQTFFTFGIFISVFMTILFIFISLFMILILDSFLVNREKLEEMKKQTKILEELKLEHK
jgi:uncharacterized membrane protein YadS